MLMPPLLLLFTKMSESSDNKNKIEQNNKKSINSGQGSSIYFSFTQLCFVFHSVSLPILSLSTIQIVLLCGMRRVFNFIRMELRFLSFSPAHSSEHLCAFTSLSTFRLWLWLLVFLRFVFTHIFGLFYSSLLSVSMVLMMMLLLLQRCYGFQLDKTKMQYNNKHWKRMNTFVMKRGGENMFPKNVKITTKLRTLRHPFIETH